MAPFGIEDDGQKIKHFGSPFFVLIHYLTQNSYFVILSHLFYSIFLFSLFTVYYSHYGYHTSRRAEF